MTNKPLSPKERARASAFASSILSIVKKRHISKRLAIAGLVSCLFLLIRDSFRFRVCVNNYWVHGFVRFIFESSPEVEYNYDKLSF